MSDPDLARMELGWLIPKLRRLAGYDCVDEVDGVDVLEEAAEGLAGVLADIEEAQDA